MTASLVSLGALRSHKLSENKRKNHDDLYGTYTDPYSGSIDGNVDCPMKRQELIDKRQAELDAMTPEWWLKRSGFEDRIGFWHHSDLGISVTKVDSSLSRLSGFLGTASKIPRGYQNVESVDKAIYALRMLKEAMTCLENNT